MDAHAYAAARLFGPVDVPEGAPPELAALLEMSGPTPAWGLLSELDAVCASLSDARHGDIHPTAVLEGSVYVAPTARIGPHAYVQGPAWFGPGTHVGHGAYVRGGVVAVARVTLGHATEVKHALLLPDAKAPHFNYVGDSVVGSRVNMGAGVKLANFKADGSDVHLDGQPTGLRKLGALLGDDVSIGCNVVTNPGTWIGPRSIVYANATVRGVIAPDTVVKHRPDLDRAPRV